MSQLELMEFINQFTNSDVLGFANNFIKAVFGYRNSTSIKLLYDFDTCSAGLNRMLTDYTKDVYTFNDITKLYEKLFDTTQWGDIDTTTREITNLLSANFSSVSGQRIDNNTFNMGAQTNTATQGKISNLQKLGDLTTIDNNEVKKYLGMVANNIGDAYRQLDKDLTSIASLRQAQSVGDLTTSEQLTPSSETSGPRADATNFTKGQQSDTGSNDSNTHVNENTNVLRSSVLENFARLANVIISPRLNEFYNEFIYRFAQTIYSVEV